MTGLEFWITLARAIFVAIGIIVVLMWLTSCVGLADFGLIFVMPRHG